MANKIEGLLRSIGSLRATRSRGLGLVGLAMALGGCSGSTHQDLQQFMQESAKNLRGSIAPLPIVKTGSKVAYSAFDLRDPFRPAEDKPTPTPPPPQTIHPTEPLEAFALESLRMTGTLRKGDTTIGLVKAPDGGLYRVQRGSYAGQSFGQIVAVTETEIKLTEYVQSGGDWETRTRSLHLVEK